MSQELEAIFRELGIAQYLDTFVEQGFDTWDTILDIQESDLDALGVKLGHRRKLQRRIANSRGIAPGASLVSPIQSTAEEARQDAAQKEASREENATEIPTVTKRKYRRHPKTDENAPERPPSAYVLFSNKLREGLRGQTLTFTEIAKLVGENWQSLSPTERERFERQANNAKEKYHREMAQYKKTEEFRQYSQYLQEFKVKQGKSGQGQEPAKRAKIEPTQPTEIVNGSSTASSGTPSSSVALSGSTSIASGNSSERIRESESREPPPSRRHDSVNSVASVAESRHSTATRSTESAPSPRTTHFDVGTPRGGHQRHSRRASSLRGRGPRGDTPQPHLPSLSDVLIEGQRGIAGPTSAEAHGFVPTFIPPTNPRQSVPQSSPAMPLGPVVPIFYHEPSSGTTIHSGPAPGFGRRPGEGPLAIHSLLSEPNSTIRHGYEKSPSSVASATSPIEQVKPLFGPFQGPRSYGTNPFRYDEFGRGRN